MNDATAKGDTTVPAKAGYTFTVTDATGRTIARDAYDFEERKTDGDGQPINNEFTVVYTPFDNGGELQHGVE